MADETPNPAVTRVLHAMTDRLHESLCNCRNYPDSCASRDNYRRDSLMWTFGHAEEALDVAIEQGWTPPAETSTPADEAAALSAAGAWTNAFPDPIYGDLWPRLGPVQQRMRMVRARAAVAAARPHLTGPLEAEVARLRAALEAADAALNTAHRIADTHGSDLLGHDATELAELLDTASTATGAVLAETPAPTTTEGDQTP